MPALANPKHERFAQELAKGRTADEAYVTAGYKANRHNAAALARKEHISTRVAEIQERGAIRAEITVADLTRDLMRMKDALLRVGIHRLEEGDGAKGGEAGLSHQHINTARQCVMDAAKLNGLIVDKSAQAQVSLEQLLKELDGDA